MKCLKKHRFIRTEPTCKPPAERPAITDCNAARDKNLKLCNFARFARQTIFYNNFFIA